MQGPYADHIIDSADVCSNCFRKNRVERVDPVMGRGLTTQLDSHLSRDRRRTTVDYHDCGDTPTQAKGVWCECGVEGSFDRIWESVGYERFKIIVKDVIRTLEEKAVTIDRRTLMRTALGGYRDCVDDGRLFPIVSESEVDEILTSSVDMAIATGAASSDEAQA